MSADEAGTGLNATLDLPMVFAIALKQVIGGGVIVLTGTAVSLTGAGAPLAYGLACLVVLLVSLPYAVLGAAVPVSGSLYRWPTRFIGPVPGFMAFWMVLATQVGLAAYAATFGAAVHALAPSVPGRMAGLGALGLVLALNWWGTALAARAEIVVAAATAAALLGLAAAGLPHVEAGRLADVLPHGWHGLLSAAVLLTFPITGATLVSELGGEMRRPGRDIPLSILGATLVAALLYVAVAVVAAGIPGPQTGRSLDQVAALVMSRNGCVLFGLGAGVISMLGIINAHMLWGSRSIVMVSRDGWLPRGLARTSRSGAPVGALLLLTALGAVPAACGLDVANIIRIAGLGATGSTILSVAVRRDLRVARAPSLRGLTARHPAAPGCWPPARWRSSRRRRSRCNWPWTCQHYCWRPSPHG